MTFPVVSLRHLLADHRGWLGAVLRRASADGRLLHGRLGRTRSLSCASAGPMLRELSAADEAAAAAAAAAAAPGPSLRAAAAAGAALEA